MYLLLNQPLCSLQKHSTSKQAVREDVILLSRVLRAQRIKKYFITVLSVGCFDKLYYLNAAIFWATLKSINSFLFQIIL